MQKQSCNNSLGRIFIGILILGLGVSAIPAGAQQPNLDSALYNLQRTVDLLKQRPFKRPAATDHLNRARSELNQFPSNGGGHRNAALGYIDQALDAVRMAKPHVALNLVHNAISQVNSAKQVVATPPPQPTVQPIEPPAPPPPQQALAYLRNALGELQSARKVLTQKPLKTEPARRHLGNARDWIERSAPIMEGRRQITIDHIHLAVQNVINRKRGAALNQVNLAIDALNRAIAAF